MDDAAAAREAALRLLAHGDRSEAEVRRRLADAGHRPEPIDGAVEFLLRAGLLDDARLAQEWTESRGVRRQIGPRRIEAELRRKGIDAETVREAVGALTDEQALEGALAYARRRPDAGRLEEPSARRRLCAALQRRGYGWHTIEQVMAVLGANN